jgi:hypothetical protein
MEVAVTDRTFPDLPIEQATPLAGGPGLVARDGARVASPGPRDA